MFTQRVSLFRPLLLVSALFSATVFAQDPSVTTQPVAKGLYELAYSQTGNQLYVVGAGSRQEAGGSVYLLDGHTLNLKQTIQQSLKPFGVAFNPKTGILYTGNTRDGAVTAVDTKTSQVISSLVLDGRKRSETVKPFAVRELAVDPQTNRVYVSGLGADSQLWVVDGASLKLLNTITGLGKAATGLAVDSAAKKIYMSNADAELVVINSSTNQIEKRVKLEDSGEHMLLNIALDTSGHRAFITDFKQPQVLVVDTRQDKVIHKIAVSESLGVLFNPVLNQLYVTHRKAGTISVIDATDYSVKRTITAPGLPNSLALSDDGKTLYVSVKQPASHEKEATQPDSVMRIAL